MRPAGNHSARIEWLRETAGLATQCFILGFALVWGAFMAVLAAFATVMLLAEWGIL